MSYKFLLFFTLLFGKTFSNIDVELDVVFRDSTVQCQYLYVLCSDKNDTTAVFDTLSFNGYDRVSLFYSVKEDEKNKISIIYFGGAHLESKSFTVSPRTNIFSVVVDKQQINVEKKNYLYHVLITILAECLLIAIVVRRSKSWTRALLLIFIINVLGFGIMTILCFTHLFW